MWKCIEGTKGCNFHGKSRKTGLSQAERSHSAEKSTTGNLEHRPLMMHDFDN